MDAIPALLVAALVLGSLIVLVCLTLIRDEGPGGTGRRRGGTG